VSRTSLSGAILVLFLVIAYFPLSGCVGGVVHSTQTQTSTQMCPAPGRANGYYRLYPCSPADAAAVSEEQVLALWGPPNMRGVKNGQDYFVYESAAVAEHGVTVFLIAPIPLDTHSGHYDTILYFCQDQLVSTYQELPNEQATVCSPVFKMLGPNGATCAH